MPVTEHQQRIIRAVEAADALRVDDAVFAGKWVVHGAHGDPTGIAVTIEWSDESAYVWELNFTEQALNEGKIDGNQIRMIDSEGEEVAITVFQLEPACV